MVARIGIVRMDALGDAVLTSGFVKAIHRTWPNAEITMFCATATVPYWAACPYVTEIHGIGSPLTYQPADALEFDVLYSPRPAPDYFGTDAVMARLPSKRKIGFDGGAMSTILTEAHPYPIGLHAWLAPFELLPSEALAHGAPKPEAWPEHAAIGEMPAVAISLGAGAEHKRWNETNFAALAQKLSDAMGRVFFVVVGGQADKRFSQTVDGWVLPTANLIGHTSVTQTAGVIKACRLFIGNDSGPKHLAAAVGTPVVEISWLNCDDHILDFDRPFEPVGVQYRVARPTRKFTIQETFAGDAIRSVTVDAVTDAALDLLA